MARKRRRSPSSKVTRSLNPAEIIFSGEVSLLFQKICNVCGLETAIFLFNRVAKADREQPQWKHCWATLPYPKMEEVDAADQRQICIWYEKLCEPKNSEKAIFARIKARYFNFGGTTSAIMDEISRLRPPPPTKRKGPHNSKREIRIKSDLRVLFDESNPNSELSLAMQGRTKVKDGENPRPLTKLEFAELLVPEYGGSAQAILRKLKYLRTKN